MIVLTYELIHTLECTVVWIDFRNNGYANALHEGLSPFQVSWPYRVERLKHTLCHFNSFITWTQACDDALVIACVAFDTWSGQLFKKYSKSDLASHKRNCGPQWFERPTRGRISTALWAKTGHAFWVDNESLVRGWLLATLELHVGVLDLRLLHLVRINKSHSISWELILLDENSDCLLVLHYLTN